MNSRTPTRRSYAKWLGISALTAIVPLIAIVVSIAIFYTNLRPDGSTGMWAREVGAILYLHAFGVLLPCILITIAITRSPPVPLKDKGGRRMVFLRFVTLFLFLTFAVLLVLAALTCKKPDTLGFELGIVFYVSTVVAPFAYLAFGFLLINFRKTCELDNSPLGLSSIMFFAVGVLLLVSLATPFILGSSSIAELIAVPVAGILLVTAFPALAIGLRKAKLEHSGYAYS